MNDLVYKSDLVCLGVIYLRKVYHFLKYRIFSDKYYVRKRFYKTHGYKLDLKHPQTLCEKIQWLKLYERKDFHTICADKYAVREYIAKMFGKDILVPLVFVTDNPADINPSNINAKSFVIKSNHASGQCMIVKDIAQIKDWKSIQRKCKMWLGINYYLYDKEWQYKNIHRRILVEEFLEDKNGGIPMDYKLHCINGKVRFIYVRNLNDGHRLMYDINWEPLMFSWNGPNVDVQAIRGNEVAKPKTLGRMIEIAEQIATRFKYVRVDFYDVDGKLYFGEITLHDGGGHDIIKPKEWDYKWGEMLKL